MECEQMNNNETLVECRERQAIQNASDKLFRINRTRFIDLIIKYADKAFIKTDLLVEMASIQKALMLSDTEYLQGDLYIFENGTENNAYAISYRLDDKQKVLEVIPISELYNK